MTAVWQMVDAILIPILTYACEAWTPNKEEITKLQTIFNEALKTILSLPKGTPTTILLNETGNYPIELTIKKKKILHAKRMDSLKDEALIKDVTSPRNSEWRKEIDRNEDNVVEPHELPSWGWATRLIRASAKQQQQQQWTSRNALIQSAGSISNSARYHSDANIAQGPILKMYIPGQIWIFNALKSDGYSTGNAPPSGNNLNHNMTVWILARNDINFSMAAGLIRLHMPGVK